jgi:hypothetical protein
MEKRMKSIFKLFLVFLITSTGFSAEITENKVIEKINDHIQKNPTPKPGEKFEFSVCNNDKYPELPTYIETLKNSGYFLYPVGKGDSTTYMLVYVGPTGSETQKFAETCLSILNMLDESEFGMIQQLPLDFLLLKINSAMLDAARSVLMAHQLVAGENTLGWWYLIDSSGQIKLERKNNS